MVKEQERIRVEWRAQQDAVIAAAHETGDDSLLELVETMDVIEAEEIVEIPRWDHDSDEDMPVAGPSR
jgi:hypothetical protein